MDWHVVSLNSGAEQRTVARINSAGFVAHCPTFVARLRIRLRGEVMTRTKILPLFPTYGFIRPDAAFRKDIFEDSKTRIVFLPNGYVSDGQMTVINSTALELTSAGVRGNDALKIKRGDLMQLLHGAMAGEPVEALEVRKAQILIGFKDKPGWQPVWVSRQSLGRAV